MDSKKDVNFRIKFVTGCKAYAKKIAHRLNRRRSKNAIQKETKNG